MGRSHKNSTTRCRAYPTATEPPNFYGLPKVHKPPCPLRPIGACRGSIMYGTAIWVAYILAPMVGKTPYHLQNSADLVNKLSQIRVDEYESLISFDVRALFTSVPVEESLTLIHEKLAADLSLADRTALSPQQVTDVLRMCLTTTYFKCDGNFYAQIEGAAMGSPVSAIVANLFMEEYEGKALEAYQDPPKYWGRYVDDAIAVIKTAHVEPSTHHLNAQHTSIQWTSELESDGKLPMLDILTTIMTDGSLNFSVYRKPTHTDQYMHFQSHQPVEHNMGVIRTLTHRADTIISDPQDKEREIKHLQKVLSVAGYAKWAWQAPGRKKIRPHPRNTDCDRAKSHVTLPYIGCLTEPISHLIRKTGFSAHAKPHTTIRSILVAPKDQDHPQDKCGVVYQLTCHDCEASYIGETERALKQRLKGHQKDSSQVGHHMGYNKHKVDSQNIRIINRDSRWFQRGVREAIQIRCRSPTLNRDRGRHNLPSVYNTIVRSRDARMTAAVSRDQNQS